MKNKIEKTDIIIFSLIFLIFGISLLSFFPGLVTSDNVDQITQALNNHYSPSHPIIHSFIIGNLTKLGGIWVPALFQIIVFALIWTYICKKLRKYNNSSKNKFFQIVFTICICIIPLNFLYSITLWKDILFSYAMLLLVGLIYIGIKEKYNYTIGQIILISLSSVLVMKIRYNGLPIGFIMFIILLILCGCYNKNIRKICTFIVSFITIFVIMSIPNWVYSESSGVDVSSSTFRATRILCIGKMLKSDVKFEESDIEFLNNIMPVDVWKDTYNEYTGMFLLYNEKYNTKFLNNPQNEEKFNEIFDKYAKNNKKLIFEHLASINSVWWSISPTPSTHDIILGSCGYEQECFAKYRDMFVTNPILKSGNTKLVKWTLKTLEHKEMYMSLYRPATYLWIIFIITCAIIIKERKNKFYNIYYVLLWFPMLMNIGTYILLIVSPDLRYFYPTFLTGYFMILVAGNTFIKDKKNNEEKKIKNNTKDPKTLIIVPAYNEGMNIEKTIKDITENTNYDYVVINDCSKDNTLEICKKNNYNVLSLPVNFGLTSGIQLGMKYAKENNYDIAIQFDGDGQHQAKYLKKLVDKMCKDNCDIVIGSRFVDQKKPFSARMLGSRLLTGAIKFVTGKKINDPTSGMRAYSRNGINEFCKNASLTPEPDTLVYMIKHGYKVEEIQVEMKDREFGESYLSPMKSIKYMTNMILSILLIRSIK